MWKKAEKIWNDPVMSKVISVGIVAVITVIYSWISSISNGKTFQEQFISFWSYKIELWKVGIIVLVFIAIFLIIRRFWPSNNAENLTPTLSVTSVIESNSRVLFDINRADKFWFYGYQEYTYKDNKPFGDKAAGSYDFKNHMLDIERHNTGGNFIIKIKKYLTDASTAEFINSDTSRTSFRIIRISFSAKVVVDGHSIWFVTKKPNENEWIHAANVDQVINNQNWQNFNLNFRIPQNVDFEMFMYDHDVKKAPSSIQIKDLVIEEDL